MAFLAKITATYLQTDNAGNPSGGSAMVSANVFINSANPQAADLQAAFASFAAAGFAPSLAAIGNIVNPPA